MEKRIIKNTDLEIAPINFGGNVFGWTLDEQQSFEILDKLQTVGSISSILQTHTHGG